MRIFPTTVRSAAALLVTMLSAALVATTLHVPSARAYTGDFPVHVNATDVTLRKGQCRGANVWAYGDWDSFESSTIKITIRGPYGGVVRSDVIENDGDGWIDRWYKVCYHKPAGRYSVQLDVRAYDEVGTEYTSTDTTSFRVTKLKPKKRSRLDERHGRLSGEREYPFAAVGTLWRAGKRYPGAKVILQARIGGSWYAIDRDRTGWKGDRRGRVGWQFKPNTFRWRFKFNGDDRTKGSASDSFRFPRAARTQRTPGADVRPADLAELVSTPD